MHACLFFTNSSLFFCSYEWDKYPLNSGYFVNAGEFQSLIDNLTYNIHDMADGDEISYITGKAYTPSEIYTLVETDAGNIVKKSIINPKSGIEI